MSYNDLAINIENVSKVFELYNTPRDQLKQFLLPRIQKRLGIRQKKYFTEFWALNNVSFQVKKGESVGIIGRNGSGKSTLLQIITGILTPTKGEVTTQGRIAALLELGSGFNLEFTGRENVYLNASLLGLSRKQIDDRFDQIVSFADIGKHIDQPVKTYSSGMLVRLAFAVQVQVEPDILIIDEALAVGDAVFQKRCYQRINKLRNNGTTILFVSHDQETIRTLTNRALLLNRGNSEGFGISSEMLLKYRRILHEEEAQYFQAIANEISTNSFLKKSEQAMNSSLENLSGSEKLSFGDQRVKITKVKVLDKDNSDSSVLFTGDQLKVQIICQVNTTISKLNVAIRIRNKEGVKIYSWGTLNQDIQRLNTDQKLPVFWGKQFCKGETFAVTLHCDCVLGPNLYEIQASVSVEETPDYMNQNLLHWVDEASFFQVLMKRDEYFFGGAIDLKMNADWAII